MKIRMRMPMKLKMSSYMAGVGFSLSPGDVTDRFPDAEAMRLIERGYAVLVPDEPENTTKARPVAETRRKGKRA